MSEEIDFQKVNAKNTYIRDLKAEIIELCRMSLLKSKLKSERFLVVTAESTKTVPTVAIVSNETQTTDSAGKESAEPTDEKAAESTDESTESADNKVQQSADNNATNSTDGKATNSVADKETRHRAYILEPSDGKWVVFIRGPAWRTSLEAMQKLRDSMVRRVQSILYAAEKAKLEAEDKEVRSRMEKGEGPMNDLEKMIEEFGTGEKVLDLSDLCWGTFKSDGFWKEMAKRD